jgi:Uma2 family endonuclease
MSVASTGPERYLGGRLARRPAGHHMCDGDSAMSALPETKMNADEFLAWAEGREGRWELHDGAVVAMSPERIVHNETKGQVFRALWGAVESARVPCRVYTGGLGVRVGAGNVFEPDATVACGPPPHDHAVEITDPVIVVEVLSPSTAAVDHGLKLRGYFSLRSVEHYLILDPELRVVIHHKRGQNEIIETRILSEGMVRLDPPGIEAPVAEMLPPA